METARINGILIDIIPEYLKLFIPYCQITRFFNSLLPQGLAYIAPILGIEGSVQPRRQVQANHGCFYRDGSGTIPIEAAMIGLNLAPGLNRSFDAQYWSNISQTLWQQAVEEACDLAVRDKQLQIFGYDIDEDAIDACRFHAREAEVDHVIHFQVRPMQQASSRFQYGVVVTNPPYGERMGDKARNAALYKEMSNTFHKNLETWSFYVITSDLSFEQQFGRKADKKRKLYNGGILCYLYQYYGPKPR